jgi:acyl-CoA synthetase (AMP-forming)/AMP-acid ligase II
VEKIHERLPGLEHRVCLDGPLEGWLDYEAELARAPAEFAPASITERDLISINYTSGTTARPKGVMITNRNAWANVVGTLLHHPMGVENRYLWTLPMFHANGWTFVWTVTAAGAAHVCLRKVEPAAVFDAIRREHVTMLCAAPTVLIAVAGLPRVRAERFRGACAC